MVFRSSQVGALFVLLGHRSYLHTGHLVPAGQNLVPVTHDALVF